MQREQRVRMQEQEVEGARQTVEAEVAKRLSAERIHVLQDATTKVQQSVAAKMGDLQDQLREARGKLSEAQKTEFQLRKDRRELEEGKNALELTIQRRLDEERSTVRQQAKREADEAFRLKEADKDRLVGDLRRQIDDLKRSAELGSQQAQGETLEVELETVLRQQFPCDTIEAVPRSVHGGDVMQHVFDSNGRLCGTILWESKRTKSWNDHWLPKLRDDQRSIKAALGRVTDGGIAEKSDEFRLR